MTTWVTHFINRNSKHYMEGRRNGYFVSDVGSSSSVLVPWWNGLGAIIDFTNNDAINWFKYVQ